MIPGLERRHGRPDLIDDPDALVTENPPGLAGRHVALQDVKVGTADCRLHYPDDRVCGRRDLRLRTIFEGLLARAPIDESFHRHWSLFPGLHGHQLVGNRDRVIGVRCHCSSLIRDPT